MTNRPTLVGTPALLRLVAAFLLAFVYAAAATVPAVAQATCHREAVASFDPWLTAPVRHPLTGSILARGQVLATGTDVCRSSPLDQLRRAMSAHLAGGGVLLLGEVHDNGAQHALRADLISDIASDLKRQRRPVPALVFEHLRTDQEETLAKLVPAPDPDAAARDLMKRLDWEKSGWPDAALFQPLFEAAIANRLPIVPGHPVRAEVRDLAMRGLQALSTETVTRLGLDAKLPEPLQNALLDELEASHCGLMPRTAFTNMAIAQRYRDAHMAASLAAATEQHGSAVLLTGNGHVRADRAVPWNLARLAPNRKVLTVMLMEVEDGQPDATSYVMRDPSGQPAADYVVLTPRVERPDPCEAMRARYKKK